MKISYPKKIIKLIINLTFKPHNIFRYLRYSIFSNKTPIDIKLPWWSFDGIDELKKISKNKIIFEYGTGGSTLLLSKVAKKIICVEDDIKWLKKIKKYFNKNSKVKILYKPFNFDNPKNFKNSNYLKCVKNYNWEILIIDGQDKSFNERIETFRFNEKKNLKNKVIILDDFWRYEKILKNNKAKRIKVFESVGPCRIGVTSTAFFYY